MKKLDLTGERFGQLVAVRTTGKSSSGQVLWLCKCDCGTEKEVITQNLRKGRTKSCGNHKVKRLEGEKFGKLTAIEEVGRKKKSGVLWRCKCECGKEIITISARLTSGSSRSCGCATREAVSKASKKRSQFAKDDKTQLEQLSSKPGKSNTSGVKGVSLVKKNQKWQARLKLGGKSYNLGLHNTLEEAALARREAEKWLFDPVLKKYGKEPTSDEYFQEVLDKALEQHRI